MKIFFSSNLKLKKKTFVFKYLQKEKSVEVFFCIIQGEYREAHLGSNNSHILAAGLYYYLASTLEYLNHFYQKKLEECCTMFTLYSLIISHPSKEQNTILNVARQQFFIIHCVVRPISLQTKQPQ